MLHPLDPLTTNELATAIATLRGAGLLTDGHRLVSLTLAAPAKCAEHWSAAAASGERAE